MAGALASFLAVVPSSTSGHIAISYPRAQGGPWTSQHAKGVHAWIGFQGKKYPCGGYAKGPVTQLKAGQKLEVEFWTYGRGSWETFPPKAGAQQGRHGGGACEFSLSYDGGQTWNVIGQYTKTCPDIFYKWPVMIPKNVPSCTDSNKCLFAWSWVAYLTNQFYHHCANVEIQGSTAANAALPPLKMTIVDVKQLGQQQNTNSLGDGKGGRSSGPNATEIDRNLSGYYAAGGEVEKNGGLDLLLRQGGRAIKRHDHEDEAEVRYFIEKRQLGEDAAKKRLTQPDL
ncbi:hypothetical protein DFQ27_006645 [Actinomortierella ambigua]|uniref:Lytic polysaccharide monooxygenase n=1 Tax=Actinomortierella ambigua TaxID=1343610 RepID=A0A9P6QLL9_9FUNG|nr:hypothetical protein DFQ27_006645 [Actinomortierella ambigua]